MKLTSSAFEHQGEIPRAYTCDGDDISPPLEWTGVPALLYDLPPTNGALPLATRSEHLPSGTREGCNDWQRAGYCGSCPPVGRHRYFFKLYALDAVLPNLGLPDKAALEKAMRGHVTEETALIGTYKRKQDLVRTREH